MTEEQKEKLVKLAQTPLDNSDAPIKAFITNLGKYNDGELVGEWLAFPTTYEKLQQTFDRIDIDGVNYEEYFVTDYETSVDGLYDCLPEYVHLDELNYLAAKLDDMAAHEIEKLEAVLEYQSAGGLDDVINLTDSLDSFDVMTDVHNEEDLGYYYIEDAGIYDKDAMGNLANYIDYERFGRDVALDEGGSFTNKGYVRDTGDGISNDFKDSRDVPDEYRIMSQPEDEREPEPEGYKYYSTQRPVDIGTFPKEAGNAPAEIVNFDARQPVENSAFRAWGYLMYAKPLTEKQMQDYELKPASDNYLKNAEMEVEQNLNQIDGLINNEPQPRADLTDGQTFEEIQELAPETIPDEKPSIKAMLKVCEKSAKDAAPALKPKAAELDLE